MRTGAGLASRLSCRLPVRDSQLSTRTGPRVGRSAVSAPGVLSRLSCSFSESRPVSRRYNTAVPPAGCG